MPAHIFIATSLDGFIARPDGDIDWLTGASAGHEGEDYGYHDFMASIDAVVMGRNSFEKVLSFGGWPYSEKPVVILTSRALEIPREQASTVSTLGGDPRVICGTLEARGLHNLYVDGGDTIRRFLAAGVVDRVIITRVPVILGEGLPLFGALPRDIWLDHVSTEAYPSGLVQSEYRVRA